MEPTPQVPDPVPAEELLDARTAAALLETTGREARRLDAHPPAMSIVQAGVLLVTYGTIWFSVRDQHPYRGPSLSAVGIVYLLVAVISLIAVAVYYRARQGVGGRSRHGRTDGNWRPGWR